MKGFERVMRRGITLCAALLILAAPGLVTAASGAGPYVEDFLLLDQHGDAHRMHYHRDAPAIVLVVHDSDCDTVGARLDDYRALRDDYAAQGVRVLLLNSSLADTRTRIAAAAQDVDLPILDDDTQAIGRSLGITNTGEVIVVDPRSWRMVYRGPLDARSDATSADGSSGAWVRDVLDALLAGETPAYAERVATGSPVTFAEIDGAAISYSETIAPLLEEKCTACHVTGGIAPWAMSEYLMVKGFAPMIREVLRTRRMPPWHLDPEVGEWQHDASLSTEDRATILAWVEAGAPRGDGPDPLLEIRPRENDWPLGEPDLILEVPAFDVPATGIVDYQFPQVENTLGRDAWVVAATIVPGDSKAVHHVLMGTVDEARAPGEEDAEDIFENYIMGYAPGNESAHMPEGTGVFVPKDAWYTFQMHYTPYGREATDVTRVGLYFADKTPDQYFRQQVVLNPTLRIPANAPAHEEYAYFEFDHDAVLHNLTPHSHYRGRSSDFELIYPSGERELILSVPNYDFNWQRTYNFAEPKRVPAGTRIVHRTIYDNSANNLGNPAPEEEVRWGLQSREEMLYGSISYVWADESATEPFHDAEHADITQFMGFLDKDIDGKLGRQEMPAWLRERIGWKWIFVDRNFDGALDRRELARIF